LANLLGVASILGIDVGESLKMQNGIFAERFTRYWLTQWALRHLPFVAGIFILQVLYPVDPEVSTSPVAIYVLLNLVAVSILSGVAVFNYPQGKDARQCLSMMTVGFSLLLLNELITWNSETVAEDVRAMAVWTITAIPIIYAIRQLTLPRAIVGTLAFAVLMQLLAFSIDLWDDGELGANSPTDWFSWIYLIASATSLAAYQLSFLYLALRPGQASHGWTVTARVGPRSSKAYFDVGHPDADRAIEAVAGFAGPNVTKLRAIAPIPGTNFVALGLSAGEVRPH